MVRAKILPGAVASSRHRQGRGFAIPLKVSGLAICQLVVNGTTWCVRVVVAAVERST